MKKILVVCSMLMFFAISASAQFGQGGDTTGMAQRMKERHDRMKAGLMDQAKLTSDEADKVLDIQTASRGAGMRGMRDMSEDDRKKKMDEMNADMEKKYKAIPLTDEKMKAVKTYMESQMRGRGGMGGNRPAPAPAQQ